MRDSNGRLFGLRVLVLRPRAQAAGLLRRLRAAGARARALPAIEIRPAPERPLRRAAREAAAGGFDWIVLTSANGVAAWRGALRAEGIPARLIRGPRIAAVGSATASALRSMGLRVHLVPRPRTGAALLSALRRRLSRAAGPRILLLQADIAPGELARGLARAGARVRSIDAYRTVRPRALGPGLRRELARGVAWALLSSASCARGLAGSIGRAGRSRFPCVSIGPATTRAAREAGLRVEAEAEEPSDAGLVAALRRAVTGK